MKKVSDREVVLWLEKNIGAGEERCGVEGFLRDFDFWERFTRHLWFFGVSMIIILVRSINHCENDHVQVAHGEESQRPQSVSVFEYKYIGA